MPAFLHVGKNRKKREMYYLTEKIALLAMYISKLIFSVSVIFSYFSSKIIPKYEKCCPYTIIHIFPAHCLNRYNFCPLFIQGDQRVFSWRKKYAPVCRSTFSCRIRQKCLASAGIHRYGLFYGLVCCIGCSRLYCC